MLYWAILALGIPAALLTIFVICSEIYSMLRVKFYVDQGFMSIVKPLVGGYVNLMLEGSKTNHVMKYLYEHILEAKRLGKPGIVCNGPFGATPVLFYSDLALVRELYLKEMDNTFKIPSGDTKLGFGFFFESGQKSLHYKGIFNDFFKVENLNLFLDDMKRIVKSRYCTETSNEELAVPGTANKLIDQLFVDINNLLLFDHERGMVFESGKSFCEMLVETIDILYSEKVFYNPINALFKDLPNKWNLLSGSREAAEKVRYVEKHMRTYLEKLTLTYDEHIKNKKSDRLSGTDLFIKYNLGSSADNKITLDFMISIVTGFFVAAFDTTKNSSQCMLYQLALRPQLQEALREELKRFSLDTVPLTCEVLEQATLLDRVVKETLRAYTPAPLTFEKQFAKDFKLGNYTMRKGDKTRLAMGAFMVDTDVFKAGFDFDVDSLTESNKRHYMPFSGGKRFCSGHLLAQMEMKILAIEILSRYKISAKYPPEETFFTVTFAMKLGKSDLILSPL